VLVHATSFDGCVQVAKVCEKYDCNIHNANCDLILHLIILKFRQLWAVLSLGQFMQSRAVIDTSYSSGS